MLLSFIILICDNSLFIFSCKMYEMLKVKPLQSGHGTCTHKKVNYRKPIFSCCLRFWPSKHTLWYLNPESSSNSFKPCTLHVSLGKAFCFDARNRLVRCRFFETLNVCDTRLDLSGDPFKKYIFNKQFVLPVPVLVVVMAGEDGVVISPVVISVVDSNGTVVGPGGVVISIDVGVVISVVGIVVVGGIVVGTVDNSMVDGVGLVVVCGPDVGAMELAADVITGVVASVGPKLVTNTKEEPTS